MVKVKVSRKKAEKRVKAAKKTVPVKKATTVKATPKEAPAVKATEQVIPEGITLLQPPSGEIIPEGGVLQCGRRKYGHGYFPRLSPANYALAKLFMGKVLKAIAHSEGKVTPSKLLCNVPNAHGTAARVFAIENSGGTLQFHSRYFTQDMLDACHKEGVQVFGHKEKGHTFNGIEVKATSKAHSNSIHLTPETMWLAVELSEKKAATL